ncbi:hypothetical protein NO559_13510 [Dasania sp. GY-MA-18]|uniref:Uncharacterized protein n=1 Tax=Dasania phycosphaerae TaxID=2950436 RepID=A0A9J6RNV7_9GAMM|nr:MULTISPECIES: hypothetical protein [Dasania]MCR8923793.1 hypothetical protein [Dasania sp. GY-MA-18]MCZ0866227.1 hypothetical protein [Dasania phycosphaerae]MCZ0869951.1 hypothetical protein [Dasania phycosphaerae]
MIKLLLYVRAIAFTMHKRKIGSLVKPIKKQKYTDLKVIINNVGLSGPNEEFAYARYLKATEFSHYSKDSGCESKYKSLREHMGLSPINAEVDTSNPTGVSPGG